MTELLDPIQRKKCTGHCAGVNNADYFKDMFFVLVFVCLIIFFLLLFLLLFFVLILIVPRPEK